MMFNELSAIELIEAISGLSGVTLQIHKDFRPIFVTPDYARLYGFDSTEQFMKLGSIMDLIPDDKKDMAIRRYQEIIRTGRSDVLTLKTQRVDGTAVWVRLEDRRLSYGEQGYCVMTVLIDITEEVYLKQQFEDIAQREQAARADLEKYQALLIEREKQVALSQLLQGVSHQLNTPLGNVRTSSTVVEKILQDTIQKLQQKTLRESDLVTALSEALEAMFVIDKSIVKASKLIKNVKFMVSDNAETESTTFRFGAIIGDAVRLYTQNAQAVHLELDIHIDRAIQALANPNTWLQIMSVLCENVVQHAMQDRHTGKVVISTRYRDEHFVFTFSDDGCGIDPACQDRIFEAFYSTQMGRNSGLGLALAYNLVTRHLAGQIQLIPPQLGVGTSIEIRLPAHQYVLT